MNARRYGWIPDLPDDRDNAYVAPPEILAALPLSVDLIPQCPPVYDQGDLNSCTANALAAAIQFDLMKQKQLSFMPSRLFLYYNERVMAGTANVDSGAPLRDGMKTVAKAGDCPESLWPYVTSKFAEKPPQPCYVQARKYRAVQYQRLTHKPEQLKGCLASGYPFVFGIRAHKSLESSDVAHTGHAPMPSPGDKPIGGHAVMAVGYDDSKQWFSVRNSWGDSWGLRGYFTLPYAYVLNEHLALDLWTIRVIT
jgi:C1A family cysteine protease